MTKAQIRAEQIRTIVAFAEEKLGVKVTLCAYRRKIMNLEEGLGDVGYTPGPPGHIYFFKSAFVGWLTHEVAHWLVATPWEQTLSNYGFDRHSFRSEHRREAQAADATCCLWQILFPADVSGLAGLSKELGAPLPSLENVARVAKLIEKAERRHEKEKKAEAIRKAQAPLSVP